MVHVVNCYFVSFHPVFKFEKAILNTSLFINLNMVYVHYGLICVLTVVYVLR